MIDGSSAEYTFLQAALTSSAKRNDAFVTFALPAFTARNRIEQALFRSAVQSVSGSASGAGNFRIADTIFVVPLTLEAFKTSYRVTGEPLPSSSVWNVGAKVQFAVTNAVILDCNRGDALTQFRLYLDGAPSSSARVVRLLRPQRFLEIVYLIE